jgi:hypothetical protein
MEEEMRDDGRIREAKMMSAIAGMDGRSVLSSEVDLRLGLSETVRPSTGWLNALVGSIKRRSLQKVPQLLGDFLG